MDNNTRVLGGETRSRDLPHGTYVAPTIQSFSPEEFLDLLGPAQGYGGSGGPVTVPVTRPGLRPPRLFPGIR